MIVVDASVWASWLLLQDVHHAASAQWFRAYRAGGGSIAIPTLALAEVAGAVARRTGVAVDGDRAVDSLLRIPTLHLVSLDFFLARTAAQLASDLRLRGDDAVYVAVAFRLGIPLVTWDREQRDRAGRLIVTR